tara:strand:+ start:6414 stop:6569 length:156 start_codon:yes stop_codon:yes gene_type:complete
MGKYILTHKETEEVIHTHQSHSLELAIIYFAAIKNLSEIDLIKIYNVIKTK